MFETHPNDTILESRRQYSDARLVELRSKINNISDLHRFPKLTIYCAGSYARLEASQYSDIDLFFLYSAPRDEMEEPRTSQIRLFSKIIGVVEEMGFPKLSNDGEYLEILHTHHLIENLGSRDDDYRNLFTARMLLLLESQCLYNEPIYDDAIKRIVEAYFRDYPDHKDSFRPIFLANDIIRYWKTLCLNYENKRNMPTSDETKRLTQKVRNFKLKFSRMSTCFGTIAALTAMDKPLSQEEILAIMKLTPRERLNNIAQAIPESKAIIDAMQQQYAWFLQLTGLPTLELHSQLSNHEFRHFAFDRATEFGDKMFELLRLTDRRGNYLRYLVI